MRSEKIKRSFKALKSYCEAEKFKGWDPYDGLNSRIFQGTLLNKSRLSRLIWIQLFRRNPVNLRKATLVKKDFNPKGLGLFLSGYCNLYRIKPEESILERIYWLSDKIIALQTPNYSGSCWGYNFDWQAKAFFQPKFTPTIVATSFIANSLIDAYEITGNVKLFEIARSSCDFILKDLNRTYIPRKGFAFSYSPLDQTVIFNASLLGCRLFSRLYSYTNEEELKKFSREVIKFCISHQYDDGSWTYGTLPHHQWIDNFHTGYNLECLIEYENFTGDQSFRKNFELGLTFYLNNFFTNAGESKNLNKRKYPIDIHSPPQLIVTLYKSGLINDHKTLVDKVLYWTICNMQSGKGFFYYKKGRYFVNRIPYIRWAQAWMFYGMSFYLLNESFYEQQ